MRDAPKPRNTPTVPEPIDPKTAAVAFGSCNTEISRFGCCGDRMLDAPAKLR